MPLLSPPQTNIVEFLSTQVLPQLFERLDQAFPEFGWLRTRQGWVATSREHTKAIADARPDRVVCNQPHGYYVHGGEPVAWVAYVNGGSPARGAAYVNSVRDLARLAGVSTEPIDREPSPEEQANAHAAQRRNDLLEAFVAQTQAALLQDSTGAEAARQYLSERGISREDLEASNLGFYTTTDTIAAALAHQGFTPEEIDASGLLANSRWQGRLVGPWRDRWGRLRTLFAREIAGLSADSPKYLYLRGTSKADLTVFGLDGALRDRSSLKHLVLVEGLLDAITLQLWGFLSAVAIGGAGQEFTAQRWEALVEMGVESVTLALDNDDAGRRGTLAAIENGLKLSRPPAIYALDPASLAPAKDPDEFVRTKGLTAWQELLEQRVAGTCFYAQTLLREVNLAAPEYERRDALDRVLAFTTNLRGTSAALDRDDVLKLATQHTGYGIEAILEVSRSHEGISAAQELQTELRKAAEQVAGASPSQLRNILARLRGDLEQRLQETQDSPHAFSVSRLDAESRAMPDGRTSGWRALDALDVRFNPGELALCAARTGHAKTSVLVGLLINWLRQTGPGDDGLLILCSAEEPELTVYHRLLAVLTLEAGYGLTVHQVKELLRGQERGGNGSQQVQVEALRAAQEALRAWERHLLIVARPAWTIDDIAIHARSVATESRVSGILVDYLQRIPPPRRHFERRDIEVSAVARSLKTLAVDLATPVVTGAQINRDAVAGAPGASA